MHFRSSIRLAAMCSLVAASAIAEEPVTLAVGPASTLVQEWRTLVLQRGEQEIEVLNLPAETDMSSLQLRLKRRALPVLSWSAGEAPAPDGFSRRGRDARWSRSGSGDSAAGDLQTVRLRVNSPSSGRQDVQLIYLVSNITWSASYQVAVRGEVADDRPVSVDLWSRITLVNSTALAFDRARLYLTGLPPAPPAKKPPGFLMLNRESPLSDLWRPAVPRPEPQYTYEIPEPVRIMPGRSDIKWSVAERLPALPLYRLTAEAVPVSTRRKGWRLELLLVLRNRRASGLGVALPPGPVDIHRGSLWGPLTDRGWLPHTPVDGEMRISLGASEDVQGWRRDLGRQRADVDAWHVDYEIEIQNLRKSPVMIEVEEAPPVVLAWELFSSTESCVRRAGRLIFRQEVPEESRHRIEYRLHVREAAL